MSSGGSLDILLEEIEALASNVCQGCTNASSEFEAVALDIIAFRGRLKEVATAMCNHDDQAKRQEVAVLINGYRPLLQRIQELVTKDQSLKKKRIWKRDKINTVALDQIHRMLDSRGLTIDLFVSTLTMSRLDQLALTQKELQTLVAEQKVVGGSGNEQWDADAQWAFLRRKLTEDGITDIDIEAHMSSIRALLQEKLPSYHEVQAEFAVPEASHHSTKFSSESPGCKVRTRMDLGRITGNNNSKENLGSAAHPGPPSSSSLASPAPISSPASKRKKSQAMFYIADRTDSESEILQDDKDRASSQYPGLPSVATTNTLVPSPLQHSPGYQCSICNEIFHDSKSFKSHTTIASSKSPVWTCAAFVKARTAFFDSKASSSMSVCGFCGDTFHKISDVDWAKREKHLNVIHQWGQCSKDTFFRAEDFLRHLRIVHRAAPGWWCDRLEHSVRPSIRRKACGPHITSAFGHSLSGRRSGSLSHRTSFLSQHDRIMDPVNPDSRRRQSSNTSRTNSIPRIRSDISEYDIQGNLKKRTITTSYTSLSDAAATPLERYCSGRGPQTHKPASVPEDAAAASSHQVTSEPQSPANQGFFCPYCSECDEFSTRAVLTRHMCKRHANYVALPVQAQKYERLKVAYKKRTRQLRSALELVDQITTKPANSDEESTHVLKGVLNDLLLETQLGNFDDPGQIEPAPGGFASDGDEDRRDSSSEDSEW